VADCVLMIAFFILAVIHKKDTGKHMRYMIALTMCFLFPTLNRIGMILFGWSLTVAENMIYGTLYFTLIVLIWHDSQNRRLYWPYLIAIPLFMMHQIVFHLMFVFNLI
jgi:hypothetical protein